MKYLQTVNLFSFVITQWDKELIVYERANEWAEARAQDVYYSYDCNYPSDEDYDEYTEEEISEMEYQDMLNDIDWTVEPFDKDNEEHMDAWNEQGAKPFEI